MRLERSDWEQCKKAAEAQIKQSLIDSAIGNNLLEKAELELKKFPKEELKKPIGV
jgi:hypothetical protein